MPNVNWSLVCLPALAATLLAFAAGPVRADSGDPGVAFISTLNGDVTVQRGDSGDTVSAGVNAPLLVGDSVWTGDDARAEIQFDYGHVVRVGPDAQIRFAALGRSDDTVQLAAGTVGVGVLHATDEFTQVETPSVTVRPRSTGFYRVTVDENGTTEITVRSGRAAILLPHGSLTLAPGSTMEVSGPADAPSYRYTHMAGRDSFEQWNDDRDAAFARSNSYRYAAAGIPGLYNLDSHGQWSNDPSYGDEWIPDVASDWSPYSTGQWTAEPYYGWTWVDNSSWGYAPFHYGRWHRDQRRNRWAWTPGPRSQPAQPWAPALVAFIGFGGGGLTVALTNSIAWVPLAPSEQPHPWWGGGARSYAANNPGNVRTVYRNAQYSNAVRSVPRASFGNGGYQRTAPVAAANLSHAIVMRGAVPVVPGPQAQRYTQRAPVAAVAARPPAAQAFHAFAATPHAPQTFVQQRAQATAVVQHAPPPVAARPQPKPPAFAQPQRAAAPVVARPAGAPAVRQAPAGTQPQRPAPGFAQPQRATAPVVVRPAAAPAVHQAPTVAQPQRQAPGFAQPQRATAPVVARPVAAPPARQAPAVVQPQRQAPAVAQPQRPAAPAFAQPQRQAPPVAAPPVRQAPAVVRPQRQAQPAFVQPQRQAPPVAAPPVRQAPAVVQPQRQAQPAVARPAAPPPKPAGTPPG
jgi:hypothetical protein